MPARAEHLQQGPAGGQPGSLQAPVCLVAGTLGSGGAERQLYYICKALRGLGKHVHLLCLTAGERWEQPIRDLGVHIHYVGERRSPLARLLKVRRCLFQLGPAVVQSQHFYTNFYASLAARSLRLPSIGAIRSNGHLEVKSHNWLPRTICLRLPTVLAANSRSAIDNVARLGVASDRLFFLPNVVDTEEFTPASPPATDAFTVLGVGRLEPVKRFDRFILVLKSLATLLDSRVRGIIVGEGSQRATLLRLAAEARSGLLEIEIRASVADVTALYQAAQALLLTSDFEGTPNVLLEAMACGLPVVATNVGGIAELVTHGRNGYLFPPDNPDEAVRHLKGLRNSDLATRIGSQARTFIEQNHSLEVLPHMLNSLYQATLLSTSR